MQRILGEQLSGENYEKPLRKQQNYEEMIKYLHYQNQEADEGVVSTMESQFQNKAEHGH